jgi:hypothetical protein
MYAWMHGQPEPRTRKGWLVVLVTAALAGNGCLGPQAVTLTRLKYNEAFRSTNDEQILLNIVRLRYADSPVFIDLPSITSQFEATGRAAYSGGLDGQGPGRTNLGTGELFFRDAPTLSYQPQQGKQVGRTLASPLTAELMRLVVGTAGFTSFLLMAVNDVNDITNAPQATELVPPAPADNTEFRELIGLISSLEQRDGVELAIDTIEVPTSDAIPTINVRGQNLYEAARGGYVFRAHGEQRFALKQRQKALALKVRSAESHSFEMEELTRRLNVAPGLETYRFRSELLDEESDDFSAVPNPLGEDTIYLNMRSTLEIMAFLSKGVCVPPEHVETGEAPTLRDATGCAFDWTSVTAGLFFVRSGSKRPREAEVAVRYRDHWFWIERKDVASRATLATLELLLSLQESSEEEAGPLLTLPVGG